MLKKVQNVSFELSFITFVFFCCLLGKKGVLYICMCDLIERCINNDKI